MPSPKSFVGSKPNKLGPVTSKSSAPSSSATASSSNEVDAKVKTSIHDYTVLAFSSRRANKPDVEASAYISLAVIYDNIENYKQVCVFINRLLSDNDDFNS